MSFEMLGAIPIKMNVGEIYLALQQGVIDGQENPFGNIAQWSWDEVQDYISLSYHVYTPITFVMNLDRYESLTEEQRAAVDAAARVAVESSRAYGAENDEELQAVIRERSPDVAFNEIDRAAFREPSQAIAERIGEIAGEDFTARFVDAASE